MTSKDFAMLMGVLITILVSAVLFGKCNCNKPKEQPVTIVDSLSTYYKPVVQILHAQRLKDSFEIVQLQRKLDSIKAIKPKTKASIAAAKKSAEEAETANDTPALITYQKQVIINQDSLIEQQEEQLNLQSNIIQRQQTTISNYATELELQKGIAKQAGDQVAQLAISNSNYRTENKELKKKLKRKNTTIKLFGGVALVLTAIQIL